MLKSNVIEFRCLEIHQPIGTFYIGVIDSKALLSIAYADVRRLANRDIEEYLGIQRPLDNKRVREINEYVKTVDAAFPTGVIISVPSEKVRFSPIDMIMSIDNNEDVAKIIDGQHRLAGLENYDGESFELNVVIFVDMELEDQANIFATINLAQTKVNKSIVYDLYDHAKTRSPQKTCHNVCRLSNKAASSPFRQKIKILGLATPDREETLTQALFVEQLLGYVTRTRLADRDILKRGGVLKPVPPRDNERLIFRSRFIQGKDAEITQILWNYFGAVEERWPKAWGLSSKGNILNKSTGFIALMRLLRPSYLLFREAIPSKEDFFSIFKNVSYHDDHFSLANYSSSGNGQSVLYNDLLKASGITVSASVLVLQDEYLGT